MLSPVPAAGGAFECGAAGREKVDSRAMPLLVPALTAAALLTVAMTAPSAAPPAGKAPALVLRCEGFAAPLQTRGSEPAKFSRGRTLPLKATLLGPDGAPVPPDRVPAPPRVRVRHVAASGKEVDRTSRVEAGDFGKGGKSFVFREHYWKFDLQTDALPESGTYVVELVSGDEAQYKVDPTCG